jgi:predicted Fe-Mo cluster-binding NifX family protein
LSASQKGNKDLIGREAVFIISGQGIDVDQPHGKKLEDFIKQVKAFIMTKSLSLKPHLVALT